MGFLGHFSQERKKNEIAGEIQLCHPQHQLENHGMEALVAKGQAALGTSWCWLGQQTLGLADLQNLKLSFCFGPRVGALLLQPREADPGTNAASPYQCVCSASIS